MKRRMVSLEISGLNSDRMFRGTHPSVRKVHSVSVKRVSALGAVLSVRIVTQERGEVFEEELRRRSLSI